MNYIDELFNLSGKNVVVIGGGGVLAGCMAEGLAKAGANIGDGTSYDKLKSGFKDERLVTLKSALEKLDFNRSSLEFALSESLDFDPPAMVEFRGTEEVQFASDFMGSHVLPYLSSLETIQKSSQRITGRSSKVKIHSISHYSPVKVSVSGIAQALKILEEMIIPWKREYSRRIAHLKEEELRINNEKAKAEALEIELEKEKFSQKEAQVRLAMKIINELEERNVEMSEASRIAYIHELMKPVKYLMESPVEAHVNRNYQHSEYEY